MKQVGNLILKKIEFEFEFDIKFELKLRTYLTISFLFQNILFSRKKFPNLENEKNSTRINLDKKGLQTLEIRNLVMIVVLNFAFFKYHMRRD